MPNETEERQDWLDRWLDALLRASKPVSRGQAIAVAVMLTTAVALLDAAFGTSVQLSIVYSFGVIVAAWSATRSDGLWMALVTSIVWVFVDYLQPTGSVPAWSLISVFVTRVLALAVIALAASKARSATETYEMLAQQDALTGLLNRRAFCEYCEVELARARRYPQPFSAIYIDIDDFKLVNDHFGHDDGDALLCELAEVMRRTLRPCDIAARVGGDEFVGVLPETDLLGAKATGERLLEEMSEIARAHDAGVSVGVVTFSEVPPTPVVVLAEADRVMYLAKRSGKGRMVARTQAEGPEYAMPAV